MPRTGKLRERSVSRLRSEMAELGVNLPAPKPGRKRKREDSAMEVDGEERGHSWTPRGAVPNYERASR